MGTLDVKIKRLKILKNFNLKNFTNIKNMFFKRYLQPFYVK